MVKFRILSENPSCQLPKPSGLATKSMDAIALLSNIIRRNYGFTPNTLLLTHTSSGIMSVDTYFQRNEWMRYSFIRVNIR